MDERGSETTAQLREEIDHTRQRLDQVAEKLGERFEEVADTVSSVALPVTVSTRFAQNYPLIAAAAVTTTFILGYCVLRLVGRKHPTALDELALERMLYT